MATVDRQSLREEFERLKAEFEHLSAADKMSAETRALFNALLMLFEVLMAIFMEKTTAKGSRNSSIPPSQTGKDETAATRPGGKGKGVTQNDARSRHSRTVTTTAVAAVDACANCGADLGSTPSQSKPRRTRIDILFEKVVHHVDAEFTEGTQTVFTGLSATRRSWELVQWDAKLDLDPPTRYEHVLNDQA